MASVRAPAVAGMFYPNDPQRLAGEVARLLDEAAAPAGEPPRAIIAPHAGYIYSGPIAASAYARLRSLRGRVKRVVIIGPAHRVGFRGLALASVARFDTPMGAMPVDEAAVRSLSPLRQIKLSDEPHRQEHAIEVHLPFLIATLGPVAIVPLVAGDASAAEVAEAIELLWEEPETFVVVSSDLSHYLDYETARAMDQATSASIEALDHPAIAWEQACGRIPIAGLLEVARRRGLKARTIDLRNSGDTAGPRDRVVGYGAYVLD